MDFPAWDENGQTVTQPLDVSPPPYDANASGAKTATEVFIEQQWRDVVATKVDDQFPLSLNRDSSYVTGDPYTT